MEFSDDEIELTKLVPISAYVDDDHVLDIHSSPVASCGSLQRAGGVRAAPSVNPTVGVVCDARLRRPQISRRIISPLYGACVITLGECAENHIGMEKIGKTGKKGFSVDFLKGLGGEYIKLDSSAGVVVLRGFMEKGLMSELGFEWDTKYWDTRRGRVLNKHARYNVCFGDEDRPSDFENKKGTIISWKRLPKIESYKHKLESIFGDSFEAEGNYYFNAGCGIGFHGDTERRKVIGMCFGSTRQIGWRKYFDGKPIGDTIKVTLNDGDVYVMSDLAVGWNWKKRKIETWRHAAGGPKYLK